MYEYLLVEDKETADFLAMTADNDAVMVNKLQDSSLANHDFYQSGYDRYAAALKRLDEYALAKEVFVVNINAEIQKLEDARKAEEKKADNVQEAQKQLLEKKTEAESSLNQKTEEEKQDGETYQENEKRLEELNKLTGSEAAGASDEIEDLKHQNQTIEDKLGESFEQITGDQKTVASYEEANNESGDKSFQLTHLIDADRLKDLTRLTVPVSCCSFLNYLHQTYKDRYEGTVAALTEAGQQDQQAYDSVKEGNKIAKAVEDYNKGASPESKYGCQYEKVERKA